MFIVKQEITNEPDKRRENYFTYYLEIIFSKQFKDIVRDFLSQSSAA